MKRKEPPCEHTNQERSRLHWYCIDCGLRMISAPPPISIMHKLDPWIKVGETHPPTTAPYYVAWKDPVPDGGWLVVRVDKGAPLPPYATHWRDDVLGLPASP